MRSRYPQICKNLQFHLTSFFEGLLFIKILIVLSKLDSNFSESVGIKVELNHSACTKTAMISENIFRFQTRLSQQTKESYLHCVWLPQVSDDWSIFDPLGYYILIHLTVTLHLTPLLYVPTIDQVGHSYEEPPYIIKHAACSKC